MVWLASIRARAVWKPAHEQEAMEHKNSRGLILLAGLLCTLLLSGQEPETVEKTWSAAAPLTIADFKMPIQKPGGSPCYAQFSLNYSLRGFDYLKRNFNQKVTNVMLTNASWIDTGAGDLNRMLLYQQILFDLQEVYAREFRKRLLENRKQLMRDNKLIDAIEAGIMEEFSEQRALFEQESDGGTNREAMIRWKQDVRLRLKSLQTYRYENEERIKL